MNILARVVSFIGSAIVALLALRFVLVIVGANAANGFVNFIYSASYPFVAPFFGVFNYQQDFGAAHIEWGTLLAIIVYAIVTALLTSLFNSSSHHRTTA